MNLFIPLYITDINPLEFTTNNLCKVELKTAPILYITVAADLAGKLSLFSVSIIQTQFYTFPGTNMNYLIGFTKVFNAEK